MDFIGPLSRSAWGHRFTLVIMDYATQDPEVVPLQGMQATGVAQALMQLFAQVGLPREVITDRDKPFTSGVLRALCSSPGITQHFTSIYHPQSDGLVEQLNKTLKAMIRKVAQRHPNQWDLCLNALLFAIRETSQASTGLAPFDLLYGRRP